jgi:Skp family chaperone for outer membrane proteins
MTLLKTIPAALWLALALSAACAAAPQAASDPASTSASAPAQDRLTREQFAACMKRKADLETRQKALLATNDTLQTERSQLQAEDDAQKAALIKLDKSDEDAVDAYNDKGKAFQAKAKDWNDRSGKLTHDVQALQAEQKAWNVDCGHKAFQAEDAEVIQPAQ